MKHNLFVCYVAVVVLIGIEGDEYCFVLLGCLHEVVLFLLEVGSIEDHIVSSFGPVFISLNVSNEDELGVFGGVNVVPLLRQKCFRLLLHGNNPNRSLNLL
jgi:hypothetical protein